MRSEQEIKDQLGVLNLVSFDIEITGQNQEVDRVVDAFGSALAWVIEKDGVLPPLGVLSAILRDLYPGSEDLRRRVDMAVKRLAAGEQVKSVSVGAESEGGDASESGS